MTNAKHLISNLPIPPGEYLEEVLEELRMTRSDLAKRMGRPPSDLNAIFSGDERISLKISLELERATKVPAHIWTGLEFEFCSAQVAISTKKFVQARSETLDPTKG